MQEHTAQYKDQKCYCAKYCKKTHETWGASSSSIEHHDLRASGTWGICLCREGGWDRDLKIDGGMYIWLGLLYHFGSLKEW